MKTLSPSNLFQFRCPIFGATVEMRGCLQLRDLVWQGRRVGVRRGCQACMQSSKCPIVPMVQEFVYKREPADSYYSSEPRVGHLQPSLLGRIARIIVPDKLRQDLDVPPNEWMRIATANEAAGKDIPAPEKQKRQRKVKEPDQPDALLDAATSGDMSAAITKAAENESGS